jgi:acetylornithine deacetylase/succinyl-diaminopimelate desuccinylase-like protein
MPRFLLIPALLAATGVAQNLPPAADQQLSRAFFKELVEVKSGYTTGSTTPAAEGMAARLRAAGFPASDIFVGGAIPKKANLVVRYRGTGKLKPILLLAHTDVVEALREDWNMDPFEFIERDGYFYGRGTGDDKAQAAVWIANLIRYKREGFQPDRDIIVALTADEEGGGPYNGVEWLVKNHRELIDAEYCLNEGGWGVLLNGKKISNDVQVSEKYSVNFRLEVRNKGGHSSLPVPDNAIYHLAGALSRLAAFGFPLKTNEVSRAYFDVMGKIEPMPSSLEGIAAASPRWNAFLRTTCVATQIEGGHAKNALPQLAAANVNCRILPEDTVDTVKSILTKVIDDPEVSVSVTGDVHQGPPSPMRPDLLKAVTRVTDTMWPGVPVVPVMVMYATDGLYLRAVGIPTYGVQGFFMDRDDIRFHGRDERLLVKSFYEGQAFLYDLVKDLAKAK